MNGKKKIDGGRYDTVHYKKKLIKYSTTSLNINILKNYSIKIFLKYNTFFKKLSLIKIIITELPLTYLILTKRNKN